MNPKLNKTVLCLRISSIIYFILGIIWIIFSLAGFFGYYTNDADNITSAIILIIFWFFGIWIWIFIEKTIEWLRNKKPWSWIAAIIISWIYVTSIFFILWIIWLIWLLNKEIKDEYNP